ncbi:MAG: hypothetical protein PHD74_01135 [Candidatus Krumholzibacteria bacterium]|nr:hypothetical protein [Candidatus Krumholzibacteria bacterium]
MMRFRVIIAAAISMVLTCATDTLGAPDPGSAALRIRASESRTFILEAGQTKLELERPFLIPGSDSVAVDGKPLERGSDYRINSLRGSIVLVRAAAGGERLTVRFSRYPLPFAPVFAKHSTGGEAPLPLGPAAPKAPEREERREGEPYQLRLSGSKTVGISIGSNKDLGLDQSLKVTMVGKVAKDLEVNAFLTDDNLPIQPEGNTEELKYLDKVYVQVKAKHTEVQLGDFTSELSWSQFSSYQRELRGVLTNVRSGGESFFAGGGAAKGRFKTARFTGREGVQGPYEILSARRYNSVVILSGTERVYFNGRLLRRGSENDYVIDYNRGTVTFMERLPVTTDSEIVIDYEMSEDNYQRSTVTAGWTSPRLGDALSLRVFLFQESDDTADPVFGAIGAEADSVLKAVGDDSSKAFTSGIEKVGEGDGDYRFVGAVGTVPAHFEFVSSGGDYNLDFYEVKDGSGDYVVDGFSSLGQVKYRYAGEGKGDFRIGKFLPLPERTRLFTIGASAERGVFFLDAEGDVSTHDKNLFSTIDDDNNAGRAAKLTGGLKGVAIPGARLSLSGEFSTLEDRFSSPNKTRESYFYRDWGIEDVALVGREDIGGARMALAGDRAWNIGGSYLFLSRGVALSARKADVEGGLGDMSTRGLTLKGYSSRSGSDRERRFMQGSGVFSFWHLTPLLTLESERYKALSESEAVADTGRYYRQGLLSLSGRDIGAYRANLSFTRRYTDGIDSLRSTWDRSRESDEITFDGGYCREGRIFEMLATHRLSRDVRSDEMSRYDLVRFRGRSSWDKAGVSADMSYRAGAGQERTREKAIVYVGENQGDYDAEGNEVGQKRGDYMLLYVAGGDVEPVRTVELSMQVSAGAGVRGLAADNGNGGFLAMLRREVSIDHFFSVVEKSRTDDLLGLYLLKPSLLQRNDVTVYGANKVREECTLFNSSKVFKLRVSYSREDEEDNRLEDSYAESFTRDVRVRAESAFWDALAITWEAATGLRERDATGSSEREYRVETNSLSQILNYRFNPSTRISLELGAEGRVDAVTSAKQISYMATPSLNSSIGERLSVSSYFKLTFTDVQSGEDQPLFFLEKGLREDWSAGAQYRFSRNVSFGFNYTGRREKDYLGEVETVHDLKVESRAYF